jgi:hypothetical protein
MSSKLYVYVGYEGDGTPIGCLISDSKEKADIAFTAMGDTPVSIECIDLEKIASENMPPNGLMFFLTSKKTRIPGVSINKDRYLRVWKRGK